MRAPERIQPARLPLIFRVNLFRQTEPLLTRVIGSLSHIGFGLDTNFFIVRKKLQLDASLYVDTDSFRLDFREIRAFMPRAARFWKVQEM